MPAQSCDFQLKLLFTAKIVGVGQKIISAFSSQLELRQYKNNFIQSKKIAVLKLPRFFTCHIGDQKERQLQIGIFLN